jgi:uncharacterized protein YdeI (YjbR/CyaY-like superfamily)
MIKPQNVDDFLQDGCGRCAKGGTPECKVHLWTQELLMLRNLCLESGLTETFKWGMPVYTHKDKNVIIMGAFKDFSTIGFFKGVLLNDPENILQISGENTQDTRLIKFKSISDLLEKESWVRIFIQDAIEIEEKGLKPEKSAKKDLVLPDELEAFLDKHPIHNTAFQKLTPGRQRSWVIFISGAKQSSTRESRVLKAAPKFLEGKGMHD